MSFIFLTREKGQVVLYPKRTRFRKYQKGKFQGCKANRHRFHYENLLRQNLLLKLNYANIIEVPRLCKIIIVPKAPSNLIRNVKLAMEIICSQKFTQTQSRSRNSTRRSFRFNKFVLNQKSKQITF